MAIVAPIISTSEIMKVPTTNTHPPEKHAAAVPTTDSIDTKSAKHMASSSSQVNPTQVIDKPILQDSIKIPAAVTEPLPSKLIKRKRVDEDDDAIVPVTYTDPFSKDLSVLFSEDWRTINAECPLQMPLNNFNILGNNVIVVELSVPPDSPR